MTLSEIAKHIIKENNTIKVQYHSFPKGYSPASDFAILIGDTFQIKNFLAYSNPGKVKYDKYYKYWKVLGPDYRGDAFLKELKEIPNIDVKIITHRPEIKSQFNNKYFECKVINQIPHQDIKKDEICYLYLYVSFDALTRKVIPQITSGNKNIDSAIIYIPPKDTPINTQYNFKNYREIELSYNEAKKYVKPIKEIKK